MFLPTVGVQEEEEQRHPRPRRQAPVRLQALQHNREQHEEEEQELPARSPVRQQGGDAGPGQLSHERVHAQGSGDQDYEVLDQDALGGAANGPHGEGGGDTARAAERSDGYGGPRQAGTKEGMFAARRGGGRLGMGGWSITRRTLY